MQPQHCDNSDDNFRVHNRKSENGAVSLKQLGIVCNAIKHQWCAARVLPTFHVAMGTHCFRFYSLHCNRILPKVKVASLLFSIERHKYFGVEHSFFSVVVFVADADVVADVVAFVCCRSIA